jgi:hypothetical protein
MTHPPHIRNHLSIRAPPATSDKCYRVAVSAALPPTGGIGENPNNLLSLSLSFPLPLSNLS